MGERKGLLDVWIGFIVVEMHALEEMERRIYIGLELIVPKRIFCLYGNADKRIEIVTHAVIGGGRVF